MLFFCAHYLFMMYGLESVPFLCTVQFSEEGSGNRAASVHSTHLMHRLVIFIFLCTVHNSDIRR